MWKIDLFDFPFVQHKTPKNVKKRFFILDVYMELFRKAQQGGYFPLAAPVTSNDFPFAPPRIHKIHLLLSDVGAFIPLISFMK